MKLQFESNLPFQNTAVDSIVDLFEGFSQDSADFSLTSEDVPNVAESVYLDWDSVATRYREIFCESFPEEPLPEGLVWDSGYPLDVAGDTPVEYPNFTIEMETGTGKTYVYLKTMYKLFQQYHFSKFVIIVPSRAIYEGVIKTFDDTKAHFDSLYNKPNFVPIPFDKAGATTAKTFASSKYPMVMIMTLDSFNKSSNKIYKSGELPGTDRRPIDDIRAVRPILILDEPQNMASDTSKKALRALNPLFALRYSATHREVFNLVYKLTPFDAYREGLVKHIQVYGFSEHEDLSFGDLELVSISADGKKATLRGYREDKGLLRFAESIKVTTGDKLLNKTGNSHYTGLEVVNIDRGTSQVYFNNEMILGLDHSVKKSKAEMFRAQIRETILAHFRRQDALMDKGVKVLSLIFIDRVANYNDKDGIIRTIFEDEFERLKKQSPFFSRKNVHDVHRGYFASKKNEKTGQEEYYDTIGGIDQKEAEKSAYQLIMKKKESLLSFPLAQDSDEDFREKQVSFIFAHSALKEGWDNPNVFQICTLASTVSEIKKRQEIGRGLRLPVNQDGLRLKGLDESILTVVANESYESYVKTLQTEYEEDGNLDAPRIGNARAKKVQRNKRVYDSPEFRAFWEKLLTRVNYRIEVDTERLIRESDDFINEKVVFPEPRLFKQRGNFGINRITFEHKGLISGEKSVVQIEVTLEDTTQEELLLKKWSLKVPEGVPLSHYTSDAIFRGFIIDSIDPASECVQFADKRRFFPNEKLIYNVAAHHAQATELVKFDELNFPVPNFLEKIGMELGLTKNTVLRIFKGIIPIKRAVITKNPEGFINEFFKAVKTVYADHIASELVFSLHDETAAAESPFEVTSKVYEGDFSQILEDFYPEEKEFAGTELIPGESRFVYDEIQVDSDVEKKFINDMVMKDPEIVLYFKFPTKFRLQLPAVIQNYNPDWGIIRQDKNGKQSLHLVRETKGNEDVRKLRFDHEKRKIKCAKKYFSAIDVDYRPIAATTQRWWEPDGD